MYDLPNQSFARGKIKIWYMLLLAIFLLPHYVDMILVIVTSIGIKVPLETLA
jgi:hypothetical protein